MDSTDDDIIITDSRNLNEEADSVISEKQESEGASLRSFENEGVLIVPDKSFPQTTQVEKPRDEFSRDLLKEGGIEIMPDSGEEPFL